MHCQANGCTVSIMLLLKYTKENTKIVQETCCVARRLFVFTKTILEEGDKRFLTRYYVVALITPIVF